MADDNSLASKFHVGSSKVLGAEHNVLSYAELTHNWNPGVIIYSDAEAILWAKLTPLSFKDALNSDVARRKSTKYRE